MNSRRNPFEDLERLFDRMGRQFEESTRAWEPDGPFGQWRPEFERLSVDLVERDEEFVATVDLPGFERDDVDVQVTNRTLRIAAEREETVESADEEYLRNERSQESAKRSIRLPDDVDVEAVDARMRNGVLTVTLPKLEAEEAREIDIE